MLFLVSVSMVSPCTYVLTSMHRAAEVRLRPYMAALRVCKNANLARPKWAWDPVANWSQGPNRPGPKCGFPNSKVGGWNRVAETHVL